MFLQKRKREEGSNGSLKKQKTEKATPSHIKFTTPQKKETKPPPKKIIDDDDEDENEKILEKKKFKSEIKPLEEPKVQSGTDIVDLTLESPIKTNSHLKLDLFERKLLESMNSYLKSRIPHEDRVKKPLIDTLRRHLQELSEILNNDNLFMISKSVFTQGLFSVFSNPFKARTILENCLQILMNSNQRIHVNNAIQTLESKKMFENDPRALNQFRLVQIMCNNSVHFKESQTPASVTDVLTTVSSVLSVSNFTFKMMKIEI
jgi:hypothetical protein